MNRYYLIGFLSFFNHLCFAGNGTLDSQTCNTRVEHGINIINETCKLPYVPAPETDKQYYLQIFYTSKTHAFASQLVQSVSNNVGQAAALQPFKDGYRLLLGPIIYQHLVNLNAQLATLGYKGNQLRHYIPPAMTQHKKTTCANNTFTIKKPVAITNATLPILENVQVVGNRLLVLPIDQNHKPIKYNRHEYQHLCQTIEQGARLASNDEYIDTLSSLVSITQIGIQYRFWLNDDRTITRVANTIETKATSPTSAHPLLCSIATD